MIHGDFNISDHIPVSSVLTLQDQPSHPPPPSEHLFIKISQVDK